MSSTNMSTIELQEWGQHRLLFDNVQFYVDGICCETSTLQTQRDCLRQLLSLCSNNRYVNQLRLTKQSGNLLQLPGIIFVQKDPMCVAMLGMLALSLLRGPSGGISAAQDVPVYSFSALCSHAITTLQQTYCSTGMDSDVGSSAAAEARNEAAAMSVMQSRRKFTKKRATTDAPVDIYSSIRELLDQRDPHFLYLLVGGNDDLKGSPALGALIALTVASRVLIANDELNVENNAYCRYSTVLLKAHDADDAGSGAAPCFLNGLLAVFSHLVEDKVSPHGTFIGSNVDLVILWSLLSTFDAAMVKSVQSRELLAGSRFQRHLIAVLCAFTRTLAENVAEAFVSHSDFKAETEHRPHAGKELEALQALFPELMVVKAHLVVQGKDVWLAALKVLVLLSERSAEHAASIAHENQGLVELLLCSLRLCSTYRSAIRGLQHRTLGTVRDVSHDGALSGAMCLERLVYDACLALVSLKANVVNSALSAGALEEMFLYESALSRDVSALLPAVSYREHFPRRSGHSGQIPFLDILLRVLEMETAAFIDDIQEDGLDVPALSKDATTTPDKSTLTVQLAAEKDIPISEVILAGNLSMLLFAMLSKRTQAPLIKVCSLAALLPNSSWFLARVLKSFLGLQVQSGVLVSDDIATIVTAIRELEKNDGLLKDPASRTPAGSVPAGSIDASLTPLLALAPNPRGGAEQSDAWMLETLVCRDRKYAREQEMSQCSFQSQGSDIFSVTLADIENSTPKNSSSKRAAAEDEWLVAKRQQKRFGSR